ncbi:MAG: hypothetical protein ACE5H5_01570 [Nitrospinota bacterium]
MRRPFLCAGAVGLAVVLAGCNTQNAEPPPTGQKLPAVAERPAAPHAPTTPPPGPAPIGTTASITGRIALAPELAEKASPESVLFVIARRPGVRLPVAVERLQGVTFPVSYTLRFSSGGFEDGVELSARLDRDGFAGPLQPGDLEGVYPTNPASVGEKHADIVLDTLH